MKLTTILPIMFQLRSRPPLANPKPITEPIMAWVADTGTNGGETGSHRCSQVTPSHACGSLQKNQ